MILKDEEIEGLFASGNIEAKIIAKAQLKKVMEEMPIIDCYGGNKLILAKDWQSLKDEVK